MKIIYNKIFPFGRYKILNLFGILFTKSRLLKEVDINHEAIHSEQMKELLWIPFYLWYAIEFIIRLFTNKFKWKVAYRKIWFEQEAYTYQYDLGYLDKRKHYKWLKL